MQLTHLLQMLPPFYLLAVITGRTSASQHGGRHEHTSGMFPKMGRAPPLRRGPPTALGNMNNYLQTDIMIGSQLLPVNIDTSSSWLWLVTNQTTCLDPDGTQVNMTTCPFAQLYQDDGSLSNATVAGPIYFGNSSNTVEYGTLTQGQVSIGGISVQGLNVVLLNTTFTPTVGAGAGTLGLGPPVMACMYDATVPGGPDCTQGTTNVSQFHMTMEAAGAWPLYSIALSRHTPQQQFGGLLGLGANLECERYTCQCHGSYIFHQYELELAD